MQMVKSRGHLTGEEEIQESIYTSSAEIYVVEKW